MDQGGGASTHAVACLILALFMANPFCFDSTPFALHDLSSEREATKRLSSFASRAASLSFHDEVVGVETLDLWDLGDTP
ncbi:hypothetical protein C4D60_Mb03t03860 [Musa balbisiana]|uniref:Uncharacterized protein n=1 Tax=Musa balbisiana TaxID=52838 RepID=A0A4S8J8E9_MUSBA|nr:hypothetical protein C4D60_Mb03t03860 [Musa balbisiana]